VRRKDKELVPVVEFATVEESERVWSALEAAGIPASVVTDPEVFGQLSISRVWVERFNLDSAKDLVADLLSSD
jgi:Tfp pilus assembly PilM family ATPase